MYRIVQAEFHTWRLMSILYNDRLLNQPKESTTMDEITDIPLKSDAELYEILKQLDHNFRELLVREFMLVIVVLNF